MKRHQETASKILSLLGVLQLLLQLELLQLLLHFLLQILLQVFFAAPAAAAAAAAAAAKAKAKYEGEALLCMHATEIPHAASKQFKLARVVGFVCDYPLT